MPWNNISKPQWGVGGIAGKHTIVVSNAMLVVIVKGVFAPSGGKKMPGEVGVSAGEKFDRRSLL